MPRPWRITYSGAKYHVTSRGNGRQCIFRDRQDYERFSEQLVHALEQDEVTLFGYAVMPNHYHLLLETPLGNIKRFMQRLNTAYSMYFRYRHSKPGHCFQGRYGAKLVEGDDSLVRLTRYIHLNPVRTRAWDRRPAKEKKAYLKTFAWSSLKGYQDEKAAQEFIDYRWLRLMGRRSLRACRTAYEKYMSEQLSGKDEVLEPLLRASRYAIGEEEFVEHVESTLKDARLSRAVDGDVYWPVEERSVSLLEIVQLVSKKFGLSDGEITEHGRSAGPAKMIALELACRYTGATQRALAKHFGYRSESTVSRQRSRLRERLESNPKLARCLVQLEKQLKSRVKV